MRLVKVASEMLYELNDKIAVSLVTHLPTPEQHCRSHINCSQLLLHTYYVLHSSHAFSRKREPACSLERTKRYDRGC